MPTRKTKLRVFPALDKDSLGLEMPLILSFFAKIIAGNPPRRVLVCSIIDTLISLIAVEVGINVEGVQKLQNQ